MHQALSGGSPSTCASRIASGLHVSLTTLRLLNRQPIKQRHGDFLKRNWPALMNSHNELPRMFRDGNFIHYMDGLINYTEISVITELWNFLMRECHGDWDFITPNLC